MINTLTNLNGFISFLQREKQDFTIETTGSSKAVRWKAGSFIKPASYISKRYMYLFSAIKKDITKQYNEGKFINLQPEISYNEIKYFANDYKNEIVHFQNVKSVDLSGAYISGALANGYISQEFSETLKSTPKKIRLVIMGSLATHKIIETFRNGDKVGQEEKFDEFFLLVWKNICFTIAEMMTEASKIPGHIFYWVDGIYYDLNQNENAANQALSFFEDNNFPAKFVELDKILILRRIIEVYESKNNKPKIFSI